LKAHGLHQPLHRASGHIEAFPPELAPDLPRAVDLEVLGKDASDLRLQGDIPPCAGRKLLGIDPLGNVIVIGRGGDRQHLADRLDPVDLAMIVDERDHVFDRRSSSAIAK
jgi:hypothetical protein